MKNIKYKGESKRIIGYGEFRAEFEPGAQKEIEDALADILLKDDAFEAVEEKSPESGAELIEKVKRQK